MKPLTYQLLFACFAMLFFSQTSFAQFQKSIIFENPVPNAPTNCNDTWTEDGISQTIVPNGLSCSFDYDAANGHLWLYPAALSVDLTSLGNIYEISVTFEDYCSNCTNVQIFENTNLVSTLQSNSSQIVETLTYTNNNNIPLTNMLISSFEGKILTINFICEPTEPSCDPIADVHTESGDVYIEDACHGVILTSPVGNCFRVRVDDNGNLFSEAVTCPN